MQSEKMRKMNGHWADSQRKAVCRRCGRAMQDIEEMTMYGEFWHPSRTDCKNDGKCFDLRDTKEVAEFVRKRERRAAKRAGVHI